MKKSGTTLLCSIAVAGAVFLSGVALAAEGQAQQDQSPSIYNAPKSETDKGGGSPIFIDPGVGSRSSNAVKPYSFSQKEKPPEGKDYPTAEQMAWESQQTEKQKRAISNAMIADHLRNVEAIRARAEARKAQLGQQSTAVQKNAPMADRKKDENKTLVYDPEKQKKRGKNRLFNFQGKDE